LGAKFSFNVVYKLIVWIYGDSVLVVNLLRHDTVYSESNKIIKISKERSCLVDWFVVSWAVYG